MRRFILLSGLALRLLIPDLKAQTGPVTLSSPDGLIRITFSTEPAAGGNSTQAGPLTYKVTFRDKLLIEPSALGFELEDQPSLGSNLAVIGSQPSSVKQVYQVPAGKTNPVHNDCNTVLINLTEVGRSPRQLSIEARAYNDGVAFRYLLPDQPLTKDLRIVNEKTQFSLSEDATMYPLLLRNFQSSWEDNYRELPVTGLHPEAIVGLPLLMNFPGKAWLAITEADIEDYAGMYVQHSPRENSRILEARLSPRIDQPGIAVTGQTPMRSPWRVLMIGDAPGRLIESNIVENLNPPSRISDPAWVKPGKAAWDWWSGPYDENVSFQVGKNTATAKHYIDFASQSGFEYFLLDGGWAARGTGPNGSGADITQAQPNIDLPELFAYAEARHVKIWLWSHWTDVERQMDQAFPLYEKWGVAGVKIDFMNRDDQWMVDFYRRVAARAAAHHLMIDFHGAFKPDGISRTYPNVITREGVLGLEYNKWSARVTPGHNVMLAFTRMLAGPMDYTPGGFTNVSRKDFQARNVHPMVMGTRAHQTALFVVFQSPFEMVSDFPEAYAGQPEFPFLSRIPTTWDETRVINAKVGDYITIARRHGDEWYIGSIAGSHSAELSIPLEFLGSGKYAVESISDAPDAESTPTHTVLAKRTVDRSQQMRAVLVSGGGQAIHLKPVR